MLSDATDHPDVETVYARASPIDQRIGPATVYRTLRLFEEADIATGGGTTCAIRTGDVHCWGANDSGQVGDGTTTPRFVPGAITL